MDVTPFRNAPCAPCAQKRAEALAAARSMVASLKSGDVRQAGASAAQTAKVLVEGAAMMTGLKEKRP